MQQESFSITVPRPGKGPNNDWPGISLLGYSSRASVIGGIDSISFTLCAKRSLRAALTVVHVLVRSYMDTV